MYGGGDTTWAPGRWLLFNPEPLFCSLPLCARRGFCCSLKRLNSGCICRREERGKCSADALGKGLGVGGEGTDCGAGGPEHPPVGMDPRGSCGQGRWQRTGRCATLAGERGPGATGVLVKAQCNSRLFLRPLSILRPVAKSPAGAGTRPPAPASPSPSVLAAAGGVFGSPLARAASPRLAYGSSRACGGRALPALAAMAPGLPPSTPIMQTRRMRPSSSSVCITSRLLGPELRLRARSPFVALSNLNNSLLAGTRFPTSPSSLRQVDAEDDLLFTEVGDEGTNARS